LFTFELIAFDGFATFALTGEVTTPFFEINDTTQQPSTTIHTTSDVISAPALDDPNKRTNKIANPPNLRFASQACKSSFETSLHQEDIIAFASFIQPYRIILDITQITETIDNRRIISQYISNKSGKRRIELDHSYLNSHRLIDTLYHEFAHFLWYEVLPEDEKTVWQNITQRHPRSVNSYAESSAEEGWAEIFTTFYSDKPAFETDRYCPQNVSEQKNIDIQKRYKTMKELLEPYYITLIPYSSYVASCNA